MSVHELAAMTSPQLARLGREPGAIGLIPLGAIEQHGPHLPVATDSLIAAHLAREVAARLPGPVLVAPLLPFGVSEHHLGFAGTVHLPPAAFVACVEALVAALRGTGLRRIAIFSAHGGNFGCVEQVVRAHAADPELSLAGWTDFAAYVETMRAAAARCGVAVPGSDVHAGGLETSQLLYLGDDPGLRPEAVPDGWVCDDGWQQRLAGARIAELSANGVLGTPRVATAAAGRAICAALADTLAAWIERALPPDHPADQPVGR